MNKIIIEKLVPGGQGIATLPDGKKAFFWNALPGEEVLEYEITKKKAHYIEAIATRLDNQSKQRIEPRDECYLATSPWQIMNYEYELEQKMEILKESFRQEGINLLEDLTVQTDGKEFFYRNKMEYALYYSHEDEQIHLAFHQRGSHRKIPVRQSSLERSEIWQKATDIVADLNARGEEARKYQSLLLRCNQAGIVSGGLYENGKSHPKFAVLEDTLLGQKYTYSPNGFFQINLPVYEMVLKQIGEQIETEEVLDLYAGVGTIGLSVAQNRRLTLVECNGAAFAELENNCRLALKAPTAVFSKSEEALQYIQPEQTVILDPPRAGCDNELLKKLLEVQPTKIIYLSCNPTTQARDVRILSEKYQIELVKPYNFFPRTPHLDNLVVLQLK